MDLPLELIYNVTRYLTKKDLKLLRLVCKELGQPVASCLFDTIYMCPTVEELEDARLILKHFPHYIKIVIFSPLTFQRSSKSSYCGIVRRRFGHSRIRYGGWKKHLDLGFNSHCRLRQEASDIISTGEIGSLLRDIICNAPNVRKVAITEDAPQRDLTDSTIQDYCPMAACNIPRPFHDLFRFSPCEHATGLGDGNRSMMRSVFLALSKASKITEISAEFNDNDYHYVTTSSFDVSPRHMSQALDCLTNLTKLRLCLTMSSQADADAMFDKTVAKALSRAGNLQRLLVDVGSPIMDAIDPLPTTSFEIILGECSFPKLRHLTLAFGSARENELTAFFEKHQNISVLVLECMELKSGLWKKVAESARQHLPIEAVQLNQLYDGFEEQLSPYTVEWMNYYGDIEKFFFDNGPNPFTATEVARYCRDSDERKKPMVWLHGGRLWSDYYDEEY